MFLLLLLNSFLVVILCTLVLALGLVLVCVRALVLKFALVRAVVLQSVLDHVVHA